MRADLQLEPKPNPLFDLVYKQRLFNFDIGICNN